MGAKLHWVAGSLAQAAATFVSQNYGAQAFDRIRRGVRIAVRISLGIAALLAAGNAPTADNFPFPMTDRVVYIPSRPVTQ